MMDYLIVSAELTLVALVAIACLRSAPARWRLYVALVALVVATLPWVFVPAIPITVTNGSANVIGALPLMVPFGTPEIAAPLVSASASDGWKMPLGLVLATGSALGIVAFAWLAVRQRASLRRWRAIARNGDHLLEQIPEPVRRECRIRILPGSSEASTHGILRPTVWIGELHVNDERRVSILLHELMHLHRHHPFVSVALTFVRCLLWWQPLVWLWVWLARRELEYDCDEACADVLGHEPYRKTLASLIRDASPRPGLALMGRRSFNLGRVRSLERTKVLRLHHRLATVVAICLVPLLALDFSAQAEAGNATTRAELLEVVERDFEAAGSPSALLTKLGDLLAVRFDTTLIDALRTLANNGSRPVFLHPDVDSSRRVEVAIAGTQEELIRAVAERAGLATGVHPTGFVVAEERLLTEPDWIARAVVLSAVPNRRVRLDIDLEVDGETIPTPVDLIVGQSNWTGFEAGGCRINLVARRIDDEGVDLELRHFRMVGNAQWYKEIPYGRRRTLIDGQVPGMDGDWCQISLLASAHQLDWSHDPLAVDGESPKANDDVEASRNEDIDDAGTRSNGG